MCASKWGRNARRFFLASHRDSRRGEKSTFRYMNSQGGNEEERMIWPLEEVAGNPNNLMQGPRFFFFEKIRKTPLSCPKKLVCFHTSASLILKMKAPISVNLEVPRRKHWR